jgi:hypothetical protein
MRLFYVLLMVAVVLCIGLGVLFISKPTFVTDSLRQVVSESVSRSSRDDDDSYTQRIENRTDEAKRRMIDVGIAYIGLGTVLAVTFPVTRRFASGFFADFRSLRSTMAASWREMDRGMRIALVALVLLGLFVRLVYITQPLRPDEAYTVRQYASKPLLVAVSNYNAPNNHILHTLMVYATMRINDSEILIRLPTLIGGVLVIPASFILGVVLYNRRVGLIAAGLAAVSSMLIEYSVNARGYTWQTVFLLVAFAAAAFLITHGNRAVWFIWVITSALGFYTIPSMLYGFLAMVIWMVLTFILSRNWSRMVSLLVACGAMVILCGVLYSPVHILRGIRSVTSNQYVDPLPITQFVDHLNIFSRNLLMLWHRDMPLILIPIVVAGVVASLVLHRRVAKHRVPILPIVAVCCAALLFVQRVVPFERTWIMFIPLYLLFASAGIEAIIRPLFRSRLLTYAGTVAVYGVLALFLLNSNGVYLSEETGTQRNTKELADFFQSTLREGDIISGTTTNKFLLDTEFYRRGFFPMLLDGHEVRRIFFIISEPASVREEHRRQLAWLDIDASSADWGGLTLDEHLQTLDTAVFSSPRPVLSLPWATVYEMVRRETF